MPAATEQAAAAVAAQARALDSLIRRLEATIRRILAGFAGWYADREVRDVAGAIATYVSAAQVHAAAVTDGYLTQVVEDLTGRRSSPVGPPQLSNLRGVDLTTVYERLGENYRYLRSTGLDEHTAAARTLQRADVMAGQDVNLAMRDQARRLMVVRNVDGWRRVVRPELSKHGSCGLCIVASDRVYHRAALMPLHARCKCVPMPIINGVDPGHGLNREDLDALYAQAGGSTAAADLKRVRVSVRQHGEMGPVLTDANDSFRDAHDAA